MDLIDRKELEKAILKWLPPDRCGEEDYGIPFEENIVVSVMMEIEEQATVEAEPVRHGKWKSFETSDDYSPTFIKECSICKAKHSGFYNYCPNCGAKMG